jgi:predicted metal-dependent hydrolase
VATKKVNGADMVPDNGEWIYIPSSPEVQEKRKKVIAKERQEYIIERARYILKNPRNLPKAYINKLQNIVDTNKLLYEEDYMRKVKLPDGTYGFASVYGTASIRTDTIRLTKLIWQNFERKVQKGKQLSKQDLIKQIDYVIVHELQHVVRQEDEHLPTRTIFESRINKWGWKERY